MYTIPGISERTAIMLLAECGADMSGSAPPDTLPAGRVSARQQPLRRKEPIGRTPHGSVAVRTILTEAATPPRELEHPQRITDIIVIIRHAASTGLRVRPKGWRLSQGITASGDIGE